MFTYVNKNIGALLARCFILDISITLYASILLIMLHLPSYVYILSCKLSELLVYLVVELGGLCVSCVSLCQSVCLCLCVSVCFSLHSRTACAQTVGRIKDDRMSKGIQMVTNW